MVSENSVLQSGALLLSLGRLPPKPLKVGPVASSSDPRFIGLAAIVWPSHDVSAQPHLSATIA